MSETDEDDLVMTPTLARLLLSELEAVRRDLRQARLAVPLTASDGGSYLVLNKNDRARSDRALETIDSIISARNLRDRFFDAKLFADPAWDMILDLGRARLTGSRISVTSLCIASRVPPTTALRWISQMVNDGIFVRKEDTRDRRRAYIALSDEAASALNNYAVALST